MSPRLTPYERHIRDLALVRMRAQRADARRAIAILCGAWLVAGLGIVVETAVLRPVVKSAHVPISQTSFWFWIAARVRWAGMGLVSRFGTGAIEPAGGLQAESE